MRAALWLTCEGEAHSNPHIDNCSQCAPWFGHYPVCPSCGFKLCAGPKRVRGYCMSPGCPASDRREKFTLRDAKAEEHERRRKLLLGD